ncbi:MAG TPA: tRNA (adenosine(37)-N6)-threonylcarbamoyltransferase complex dimerization subunit type 1 TsaB [Gammaproteobacteria bacterium]|nr:tRNA (adenosine(37)-N6)-threonylcarbamoyltransferase complex dimerization subunit type 1 TsaB [Gammaproteobacteria bacterium]
MNLLGFETSSSVGSVALETPGGVVVRELATPREQTEQIIALTDELLRGAGLELDGLDGIAFGRGPGSFTGLRVSVAVAQGLAAVNGTPLLPVSSLLCLAQRVSREHGWQRALVCIDAHMGEVYWAQAHERAGIVEVVGDERLGAPAEVGPLPAAPYGAVGSGFAAHAEALAPLARGATEVLPAVTPSAVDLFPQAKRDLAAGRVAAASAALPVYLREHTAWRRSS